MSFKDQKKRSFTHHAKQINKRHNRKRKSLWNTQNKNKIKRVKQSKKFKSKMNRLIKQILLKYQKTNDQNKRKSQKATKLRNQKSRKKILESHNLIQFNINNINIFQTPKNLKHLHVNKKFKYFNRKKGFI